MKHFTGRDIIINLVYILVGGCLIAALWGTGVVRVNWQPPPDTANLEARVTNLEKIVGLKPGGKLIMPTWEKEK